MKLECYGDVLFMVLWFVWYFDDSEEVEFGEVYVLVGLDFVVMICYVEFFDFGWVWCWLESDFVLFFYGFEVVLYVILDEVVDEYVFVFVGFENDIDEIES